MNSLVYDSICREVEYYSNMVYRAVCPWQRMYFEGLLQDATVRLRQVQSMASVQPRPSGGQGKEFTLQDLAQYDGSEGKPAYVAVDGIVYNVSVEPTWGGGTHFGLYAGRDLTTQFAGCHGKEAILRNLPMVGVLVTG